MHVHLRWLIAVAPEGIQAVPPKMPSPGEEPGPLRWGWREEPFTSVLVNPRSVRPPVSLMGRFKLSGILWDLEAPTCVVNGSVLKAGDSVQGYRVILITQKAVLLEGKEGEILLLLSS